MQTINWNDIDLVVFDVDGTLYSQKRLRLVLATKLIGDALKSGSLETLHVLRAFRKHREILAESSAIDFATVQFEEPAFDCDCSVARVKSIVNEWIEERPLAYLRACRRPGVAELFQNLRRCGRTIAIWSDYAAAGKLKALSLEADIVVSAADRGIQRLKPSPDGLLRILNMTGISAARTLMVGDRFERDWLAASRAGVPAAILSKRNDDRCTTFRSFRDEIFLSLTSPSEMRDSRLSIANAPQG